MEDRERIDGRIPVQQPAPVRSLNVSARQFNIKWTPRTAMLVWGLVHVGFFLGIYKLQVHVTAMTYYAVGSDTRHVYWPAVRKLLAGHIPYIDPHFFVEYPPPATAFFLLPALLHPTSLRAYDWLFAVEVLAVDLATLPLIAQMARRQRVSTTGAITAYGLLIPLLGSLVSQRFDLVPATLALGAILALLNRRSVVAWVLLLFATLMKLYPAVLVPLFLLYEWRPLLALVRHRPDWRDLVRRSYGATIYAAGLIGSTLAWQLLAPTSLERFVEWETRRGIEIESLVGSLTEVAHLAGLTVSRENTYGSYDVASVLTPTLRVFSTVVTLVLLTAIYISYARDMPSAEVSQSLVEGEGLGMETPYPILSAARGKHVRAPILRLGEEVLVSHGAKEEIFHNARSLVIHATMAVLAVLLGSKLLSIQFLLWVVPLLVVQPYRPRHVTILALIVVLLSQWVYPTNWISLWRFDVGPILMLAIRNLLLVGLFIILWRHRAGSALRRIEIPLP